MKTFWTAIEPWIDKEKYALTTFCLLLFYTDATRDKVPTQADLISVSGQLKNYSFTSGRRGSKMYYIWLDNYPNRFQIPADFLTFFEKEKFIETSVSEKELHLKVSKNERPELGQSGKTIFIFGLDSKSAVYLDFVLSVKQDNSSILILLASGFAIAGIVWYCFKRSAYR